MSDYRWEGRTADEWQHILQLPAVHLFDVVDSTNNIALDLANASAASLTLVVADYQTAGRGRAGRQWTAQPGAALLCSVIFQTELHEENAPGTAPIRVGSVVAQAIATLTGQNVMLKWPNDVVLPGAGKVAGVLCEGVFRQGGQAYIVAGIGVNVRSGNTGYVSLAEHGPPPGRGALLQAIVQQLHALAGRIADPLNEQERAALRSRDLLFGELVENDEGVRGRGAGITADGSLLIETATGMRAVQSATIRLAETGAYPGSHT